MQLVNIAPAALVIGTNIRLDARLDKGFLASIRERGVLQPIVAYPGDDGLIVRFGQRRTLAAVEVGRESVPVVIAESAEAADTIVDQLVENDQRSGLTTAERVKGYEQLALLGLTAGAIAKRTGAKRADVETALTVSGSELAAKAAERWDWLTLEHTAALAEFEQDADAVKALVAAAKSGQFAHTLQRLRDDRAEQEDRDKVRAELVEAGFTVIERQDMAAPMARCDNIGIDPEDHKTCGGHGYFLTKRYGYLGEDHDDTPASVWVPIAICVDPAANGHEVTERREDGTEKKPMSDDEKAERKATIQRNKDWKSATTVRREWIKTFAARKTAPAGAEQFIASCLLHTDHSIRRALEDGWPVLREALGHEATRSDMYGAGRQQLAEIRATLATATPKRATLLTAAALLCSWEARADVHTWKNPNQENRRYLGQMRTWGYELSDIEQLSMAPEPVEEDAAA